MPTPITYSVYQDGKLLHENITAEQVLHQGYIYGYRKKALEKLLKTNNKRFAFVSCRNVRITKNFPAKAGKSRGPQVVTAEKIVTYLKNGSYLYHSSFMGSIRLITSKRTIKIPKELLESMIRNTILELDTERSKGSLYRSYYTIKSIRNKPSFQLELPL
jgi:hypothetical protein